MKKTVSIVLVFVFFGFACSKGYVSQTKVGQFNILIKADRYPLLKGDNRLAVVIIDPAERTVKDAKVEARYYLPVPDATQTAMRTQGVLAGDKYFFTVSPDSEGVWKMDLTVSQPHKPTLITAFGLVVR